MSESKKRVVVLLVAVVLAAAGGYWVGHMRDAHAVQPVVEALLLLGNPRRAIEAFEPLHQADPSEPLARAGLALAHYRHGRQLERVQKTTDSMAAFTAAIRLRADVSYFHTALGAAHDADGRPDRALAEFQEAARLDPKAVGARIRLWSAFMQTDRFDEAKGVLEALIELASSDPNLRTVVPRFCRDLAGAYEGAGQAAAAAALQRRADELEAR